MAGLLELVRNIELVVFVGLALASLWQWRRTGGAAGRWLAATFSILGVVVVAGRLLPKGVPTPASFWAAKALIALLVLFPYCLYRFTSAFVPSDRTTARVAAGLSAVLVAVSLALPRFPLPGEPQPAIFRAYVFLFLFTWTLLSVIAVVRLWRGGRRQPRTAAARARLLALGAITLNLALLPAALPRQSAEPGWLDVVVGIWSLASAAMFFLGFAPPALLRALWRRPAERALREAQLELAAAVTPDDVGEAMLPFVSRLFGSQRVFLVDRRTELVAAQGLEPGQVEALVATLQVDRPHPPGILAIPLAAGWVGVEASPFTPYFGRDELNQLAVIGAYVDLALDRADLFNRERRARQDLERTTKELEALLYGISHDLKNPIVTVLGYVDVLDSDYGDRLDEDGRYFLRRMSVSALYMQQLLQDLLELSRVGRTQLDAVPVALQPIVEEIADEVGRAHPKARIEVGALPVVRMNPVRVRQLFTNLLENAVRHGGREDITVRVDTGAAPDGEVGVWVSDNGRGIPAAYRERVFGIFERLDDGGAREDGTGIGLAICRKIVESFDGRIEIGDAQTGTRIEITLPKLNEAERALTLETVA